MDTLKNPAFWMFVAAVVLINTFISPRNLDNWGGFIRVTGYRQRCCGSVCVVSCGVIVPACTPLFGKTHGRLLSAVLDIFNCSDRRFTFVVWMAPILEPYDVPNFNGVV